MNPIITKMIGWFAQVLKNPQVQELLIKSLDIFLETIAVKAREKNKSENMAENL